MAPEEVSQLGEIAGALLPQLDPEGLMPRSPSQAALRRMWLPSADAAKISLTASPRR